VSPKRAVSTCCYWPTGLLLVRTSIDVYFLYARKECPKLGSEQQAQVHEILRFSQSPEKEKQMLFGSIVTDFALRERLGYQMPVDKVDMKARSSSYARSPSKKSWAHKNIGTSSKAGAGLQPVQTATALGPSPMPNAQSPLLALVAEEGSSRPKQKSDGDASAIVPLTKKGRVDKARKLLWTIAHVRSNAVFASYGPSNDSGDARPSDGVVPLDDVPLDAQQREREDSSVGRNGTRNPLALRDKGLQILSRPSEQILVY
jgi:hypothetical protein